VAAGGEAAGVRAKGGGPEGVGEGGRAKAAGGSKAVEGGRRPDGKRRRRAKTGVVVGVDDGGWPGAAGGRRLRMMVKAVAERRGRRGAMVGHAAGAKRRGARAEY